MNSDRPSIDVIILSYCKSQREYDLTAECLGSLHASEQAIGFKVVLVETASRALLEELSPGRPFPECYRIVFPDKPFNYNEFLQLGFQALRGSNASFLLIANNDVVFGQGFAAELMRGLQHFDSVSPWCPGYHEHHFAPGPAYYVGCRASLELCGWAIMFRKEVLAHVPFEELFPIDFPFWFQDNYYGFQLARHRLRHALVRAAHVVHLFEQSHGLIDDGHRNELTRGAANVFERMTESVRGGNEPDLTIAIPTLTSRVATCLPAIVAKLEEQARDKSVEILALLDNRCSTLGSKRNALARMASGRYLVYVDDDDDVVDDYVNALLAAISEQPAADCIVFDAWVTVNGEPDRMCKYGVEFDDVNTPEAYLRRPNHICCFRTELARKYPREDITFDEDTRWASLVRSHIRHQRRIDQVLYHYRCHLGRVDDCPPYPGQVDLSICILSVPSRVLNRTLSRIVEKLERQSQAKAVEILGLLDNKLSTIGAKRNSLLGLAQGRFVAFVDDDDDVADDYVDALLEEIGKDQLVDCIVFDAWVTVDGREGKPCRYGIEFATEDTPQGYYRRPNHICCLRRELVDAVPFDHVNWHEDFRWADAVWSRLRRQARIPRILYYYQFSTQTTQTGDARAQSTGGVAASRHCWDQIVGKTASPSNGEFCTARRATNAPQEAGDALPILGFLHVALLPGWREIVEEQLIKLRASGLYDKTERIVVGLVGGSVETFDIQDEKFLLAFHSPRLEVGELPTLECIESCCRERECLVYYLHTKGVTWNCDKARDWRRLMEHFIITRHEDCLQSLLGGDDACGVNWHDKPVPHFSGNFWWARASHIRSLPPLCDFARRRGDSETSLHPAEEFWIGANRLARIKPLHESGVNHYHTPYPRSKYASLREVELTRAFDRCSPWRGLENRFQDLLEPLGDIRTIVAIGVEDGFSLFSMATAAPHATILGIDSLDGYPSRGSVPAASSDIETGSGPRQICSAVGQYLSRFPNVLVWQATSEDLARRLSGQIDVLHIDGIASYGQVTEYFRMWEPLIRPGGCVLLHDTESLPDSVGCFFRDLSGRKAHISGYNGLGAWYKPLVTRSYEGQLSADRPRLSLCMIVRDSAATLEDCLTSIRPWVDETIVVDTGSIDSTPQIAERCGARLFHFPWCDDFSAARNESIRHARGEWIFWMDADDTIDAENGRRLRALVTEAASRSYGGYVVQVHCPSPSDDGAPQVTVVDHVKLFRNHPELRFEGRIHEQILPALRRANLEVGWTDIVVVHSGADHSAQGIRRKQERDLRILGLELAERPDHPFVLFNLGMTYADVGDHDKAVDALSRSILISGECESHVRKAYALLVGSLTELGRSDAACEACNKGRRFFPEDAELLFRQGLLFHRQGRLIDAAHAYEALLHTDEAPHFASIDTGIQGYKAHHNLALVYRDMGKLGDAERQWRQAVQCAPLYSQGWRLLGDCLIQQEKYDAAKLMAAELLRDKTLAQEGILLKAQLAEVRGEMDEAKQLLCRALESDPDAIDLLDALARILFHQGEYASAQPCLLRLTRIDPHNASAYQNLGTTYLQIGDLAASEQSYRKALELRPQSVSTLYYLGRTLYALGRTEEALQNWRDAHRLNPDDQGVRAAIEQVST